MLAAVRLARKDSKQVLLIDRDLHITLQLLNRSLGWRECKQFMKDLWRGVFGGERLSFDPSTVPDEKLVLYLLAEMKRRYPRPYHVLVTERNSYMVASLLNYHAERPFEKVLVVVGAGHVHGMQLLLEATQQVSPQP